MSDSFFFHYAKYLELITAIIGFLYWNKLKKINAASLPVYLIIIFTGELVAYYLGYHHYENLVNNIYTYILCPLQILYFIWFIGFKGLQKPKLSFILILLFIAVFFTEYFLGENIKNYAFTKSYGFGGILLSLLVLLYLVKLAKSKGIIYFYKDIFFWICVGITVYHTLSFPFYTFYNSFLNYYTKYFYIYRSISNHLSLSMYFIFIIGIVCSKKI